MTQTNAIISDDIEQHQLRKSPCDSDLRRVFETFDINQNGQVDLPTLVVALKELGVTSCIYTARKLLESLDINLSGHIDFEDFHACFDKAGKIECIKEILSKEALKFVNYKLDAESGDPNFSMKYKIPVCHRPAKRHAYHSDVVQSVHWVGEDRFVSGSLDGRIGVWGKANSPERVFNPNGNSVYSVSIVPNSSMIITSHADSSTPLNLVDCASGTVVHDYKGTNGIAIMSTDVSGEYLAVGSRTGQCSLYTIEREEPVSVIQEKGPMIESVSFNRSHSFLAVGDHLGTVSIFDVRKDAKRSESKFDGSLSRVSCVKWLSENELVTGGDDYIIRRFDIRKSGEPVGCLLGHSSSITSIGTITDRGHMLLSGAMDGSVRIWNVDLAHGKRSTNVKFHQDEDKDLEEDHAPKCALIGHTQAVKGVSARKGSSGMVEIVTCSSDTTINHYSITV